MEPQTLSIRGARMHNLKNINVDLPRNALVVFTGLSGSGKSTLAFDTLYAEGQRRYVESLSTYARQFLGQMDKPDVDTLEGLSPAVSIEQKTTSKNPRSTVGTVTEIYDHLRLLFARCGTPCCPKCGDKISSQSIEDMVNALQVYPEGTRMIIMAPLVSAKKGRHEQLLARIAKEGFVRVRVDGSILHTDDIQELDKNKRHTIEVVVDRVVIKEGEGGRRRLNDSISTSVKLTEGFLLVHFPESGEERLFSEHASCHRCSISMPELSTQLFSFNNPQGACETCSGLGIKQFFDPSLIVPNPELSLAEGAVAPWGKRGERSYSGQMLAAVASHYSFSMDKSFSKLPKKIQQIILYGSGTENVSFFYQKGKRKMSMEKPYEGVIPQLNRRFLETQSAMIREELGRFMNEQRCPDCDGARLKPEALAVKIGSWNIHELTCLSIDKIIEKLPLIPFTQRERQIGEPILKEIVDRLSFLDDVGLGYLSLERRAGTLSGGEAQRIRLASQIGSRLAGVLYILDEPSIGLHQRDNQKLINTLVELRDLGNSVIVVEHDTDTILTADHVLDMGPGAGVHGGEVVYSGDVKGLLTCDRSLTGRYLAGAEKIAVPETRRKGGSSGYLRLRNCTVNNLKGIDVSFPLGVMTCVTGVSGSGKSSLVIETLFRLVKEGLNRRAESIQNGDTRLTGLKHIDKIIDIDQSPIGRTPRSNPATYTGVFTPVRELFARLPESRSRGYKMGQFSFNVKGGRCEACEGEGVNKIAMHFLPDIYVVCDSCGGKRYNRETLDIRYRGKNIHEILAMTVEEALDFFKNIPPVKNRLQTLYDVGLTYITLGQSSVTLSGGEAQRVKLAKELSGRASGQTLYILDEPTTGLHPGDIRHLLEVLGRLVDNGNSVVIIEHNLDVIKSADYVIDIGPEGGDKGGRIVATGTPEELCTIRNSYTGFYLQETLQSER